MPSSSSDRPLQPHDALQQMEAAVRQRAQPLAMTLQHWVRALGQGHWPEATALLEDMPVLAGMELSLLDKTNPGTSRGMMPAQYRIHHEWGSLPFWLAHHVDWNRQDGPALDSLVVLLRTWHQQGGAWHQGRPCEDSRQRPFRESLLEHLGQEPCSPKVWTTLLRAGWPADQEGWVLGTLLDNPDGPVSARRLKIALVVVDERPALLDQQGSNGETLWHLMMANTPGLLGDNRYALVASLVDALRRHDPQDLLAARCDGLGRRPVDLILPEVSSNDPQEHEAYRDFPYAMAQHWLGDQPDQRLDPALLAVWQRQVELDAPKLGGQLDFQMFQALLERTALQRLDLGEPPLPAASPRRRF